MKSVKIGQALSEKTFNDYIILYMYIAQGEGQVTLGGQNFDKILTIIKKFYYFNLAL